MTLKRVGLGLLLVAIGFVAGAVVGYHVLVKPFIWLGTVGRDFTASEYAIMQSREASYPEARDALEAYIRYLDASRPVKDPCTSGETPWFDQRGIRFAKTLAWIRLAMLHENNGNASAAGEAWRRADELVAQGTWKDRSHQHFRELIMNMDRIRVTPAARIQKGGGA